MERGDTLGQVNRLLAARRYAEAARLLAAAAEDREPEAMAELAHWRIAGNLVRRDLPAARFLVGAAGRAGDRRSALLHACFLASGTGGPDDWPAALAALAALAPDEPAAAAQLRLIGEMDLDPDGFPARPLDHAPLGESPRVVAFPRFMTAAECAWLIGQGEPSLTPSMVVDPATGRMIPHPIRSSDGTIFGVYAEDLVVNALNRRIAAASDTAPAQGEPLQLLRYRPGGEYRAHMDALGNEPNQRILTMIVYLNDGYEGGETQFLRTGLSFRGKTGDALLFRNAGDDGRPDPMALHAGLPVTRGTKLIASRWIRQRPFAFPAPAPLLGG